MTPTPAQRRPDADPEPSSPPFSDLLCFDLYAAQRAVTAVYRAVLDPLGITYPQYLVLVLLWQRGPVTVREVTEELGLDYGTVSPLLKRLESRGLVARRRRPDDERSVEVTLTDAGRELKSRRGEVATVVQRALGLDERGARRLHRTLAGVETSARAELGRLGAGRERSS